MNDYKISWFSLTLYHVDHSKFEAKAIVDLTVLDFKFTLLTSPHGKQLAEA